MEARKETLNNEIIYSMDINETYQYQEFQQNSKLDQSTIKKKSPRTMQKTSKTNPQQFIKLIKMFSKQLTLIQYQPSFAHL